jgi:DNA polymerase III delta subunit
MDRIFAKLLYMLEKKLDTVLVTIIADRGSAPRGAGSQMLVGSEGRILGTIGGHFRKIATARTLLDNGRTAADLMTLTGLKDYPARKTMSAASRFSAKFCARAAELVLETDYKMKTSFDDNERLLELLILQLAQEARNG